MSYNSVEELKPIFCPAIDSHNMHASLVRDLQVRVSKKVRVHIEDYLVFTYHLIRCQMLMHKPPRTIAQLMARESRSQRG